MTRIFSIILILILSVIGVCGDYFLKRAGEGRANLKYILFGVLLFIATALGWFVAYKGIKISSAGFLYGISTSVLLLILGSAVFGEKISVVEFVGMGLAIISFILLSRFA